MSILGLKRNRDIRRQKWQFVAVLVTVVLGVALFAGMFNAYLNLGSSLESSYNRLVMADMTVTGAEDGFLAPEVQDEVTSRFGFHRRRSLRGNPRMLADAEGS